MKIKMVQKRVKTTSLIAAWNKERKNIIFEEVPSSN